mgnify:CR=1 FL=1
MPAAVSLIVPVYRVEEYLPRCLKSIEEQTMQEGLEVLLVDDGSPDRCGEMCEEFARTRANVRVIHKQNGGLSSARNAGIDVATGEYLMFLDSDDFLRKDACETAYRTAVETGADIVEFAPSYVCGDEEQAVAAQFFLFETVGIPIMRLMIPPVLHSVLQVPAAVCSSRVLAVRRSDSEHREPVRGHGR